ncbi:MAG TPA: asparagine synthase-related protein, partial [Candidatus Pelethenecus sp.]|nr:asparagine synthase-related protein [Candidatus Pelethenecus sp.]
TFPWIRNLDYKESLLNEKYREILKLKDYVMHEFNMAIQETPVLKTDSKTQVRQRQLSYINMKYFMTNLLDRKDRLTMAASIDVRIHSSTQKKNKAILYSKFDSSAICFIM